MAKKLRFGQRTWHFSDAGTKFDGRPRPTRRSSEKPISPALKRNIAHCKRCGSRVISNVNNCPFCGRALRPVYARLWFWLIMVVVVGVSVVALVNYNLPQETTTPSSPTEPELPQVIGGAEGSSVKDLSLGTGIDNSGLEVTVSSVVLGPVALDGTQTYLVGVEFVNKTEETVTLYSTQWMLQTNVGTRLDTFVGTDAEGTTITSNFVTYELTSQGRFSGQLYFAVSQQPASEEDPEPVVIIPNAIIYQPSALVYDEDLLVTWAIPAPE